MLADPDQHARLERILAGALRLWTVRGSVAREAGALVVRGEAGMQLRVVPATRGGWAVFDARGPLGEHAGLPGLLRCLREELAPDAAAGRLIIGSQPLL